jgi:predicted ATPase/DNA-binding winged helix-turn-helix (wHTH) protein
MTDQAGRAGVVLSFGPFTLVPSERLLTRQGAPLRIGGRTLDMLLALVAQPNKAIHKRDLMAEVWPNVTVSENSLRFHIASLRKALGDGQDGARYITTLAGRGYCFVAPIVRSVDRAQVPPPVTTRIPRPNVPNRLVRMVGRTDGVQTLSTQLVAARFITIVGAAGVGKTTVALAIGHDLIEAFGTVLFVDLGALNDPRLAATSLASMLALSVQSDDPTPTLIACLRDQRILLILDNCEHLIEAAADLAERIFVAAPQVHILATSREALRVEGEHVHRLEPLAVPPDDPGLTATAALTYPAVQLFMERAAASGASLDLTDADAAIVTRICRRLDGIALAIELAAGRVEAYGLQQMAALLEERLSLLWPGQRTAPPRQQTLKATLDWSYELLTELERQVLRRFAVFAGDFTMDAALAVLTSATIDRMLVLGAIESLVAKSMAATNRGGTTLRYRLLDTTRAYLLGIAVDETEFAGVASRHAMHYRRWLEQTDLPALSNAAERTSFLADIGNARAALEWCFGAGGDAELGIELAAAAVPAFLAMSLLTECHRWSERALSALGDAKRGGPEEMHLQAALGISLMYMRSQSEAAIIRAALDRSLAIAEQLGDGPGQLRVLGPLHMFHLRIGDFRAALEHAMRASAVSRTIADPAAMAFGGCLLGIALHRMGNFTGARVELETVRRQGPTARGRTLGYLGFDGYTVAGAHLARTLWLLGYPAQSRELARQAVREAADLGHPMTLSIVLIRAIAVFRAIVDMPGLEEHIDWFIAHARSHSQERFTALGQGFKGQLELLRGDAESGLESLRFCLAEHSSRGHRLRDTVLKISLTQGLSTVGRFTESMALVDETIRFAEDDGDLSYLAELLRVKGNIFLALPQPCRDDAETCFLRSLAISGRQGARAWELRTAMDVARLWAHQGRSEDGRALLRRVFEQFTEGLDTADLKTARGLLASFG